MKKKKVSIIILNYNGKKYIEECITSVKKQDYPNFEIIVVDNMSTDGSCEMCDQMKDILYFKTDKNLGFAGGNNFGVQFATGDYIALLNNDTKVDKKWLSELVKALESDEKIGIVMSKIYNKYGASEYQFDGYGTSTLMQYFAWNKKIDKDTLELVDTFYAGGCSLIYKKELIDLPFDDDYFLYSEDVYLSWYTRLKGLTIKVAPKSLVWHEGGAASKNIGNLIAYYGERNRIMNILIFFGKTTFIKVLPLLMLTTPLFMLHNYKHIIPYIKAYWWILTHPTKIGAKRRWAQDNRVVIDSVITQHMSSKIFEESNISNLRIADIIKIFNKFSKLYCRIMRLKTCDD